MFARACVLIFAMLFASTTLWAQQDPLMGTWKLNLAKSKYDPGPPPRSTTTKRESSGANGVKYTSDTVTAQGESRHIEYTANYDAKDYSVKGDPNRDMVSLKRMDGRSYEGSSKKGGGSHRHVSRCGLPGRQNADHHHQRHRSTGATRK